MVKRALLLLVGGLGFLSAGFMLSSGLAAGEAEACIACHTTVTPGIVEGWQRSRHSQAGVSCFTCHQAMDGDPSAFKHNGFTITAVVSPNYCARCHAEEVEENLRSKHAFAAVNGPLKPYYKAAKEQGLDPFNQETAKQLDPEEIARRTLSPLFPDSGILKKIGLLDDPQYTHTNATALGCMECHGTFVIAEEGGRLRGWPNNGVGRINPDGSLGSCAACHTRHTFSIAEARKPDTCGQCHLGPDHPQIEIYLESKHGNLYLAMGEEWDWEAEDWGPDDITAPTCATCHLSAFGGIEGTHDVGARLKWEIQSKDVLYQSRESNLAEFGFQPDREGAGQNRQRMVAVCNQCHSPGWTEGYFVQYENVLNDYQKVWDYTKRLLAQAYDEGLISQENPIDEQAEIYAYLIWHHEGRRWRMGASMMGPDWTQWNGAVNTIMNQLGGMIDWIETQRRLQALGSPSANMVNEAALTQLSPEALWEASVEARATPVAAGTAQTQVPSRGLLGLSMAVLVLGAVALVAVRRRAHPRKAVLDKYPNGRRLR